VTDEHHMEQVKSDFDYTNSFHARQLLQKLQSLLTNSLGKQKVCAKWILRVLNSDRRAIRVLLATTRLQLWRKEGSAFVVSHFNS